MELVDLITSLSVLGVSSLNPMQIVVPTDMGTSGVRNVNVISQTVSPSGASTRQVFLNQFKLTYNSSQNMLSGGYLNPSLAVLETAGTGTHDKLVGNMVLMNLTGGNITSTLGYEFTLPTIGATTQIGSLAAYYVPNLNSVTNIGNVLQGYAFANDQATWHIKNSGRYLNAALRELSPPNNPGLVSSRYYSTAPASGTAAATPNVAYFIPVYVPERTTITKLGFNVSTAATGKARIGLYNAANGAPTTLIVQGGVELDTSTTGDKEVTISQQVDSGLYFESILFSGTPTIATHTIPPERAIQYGSSTSSAAVEVGYIPFAYASLPASAGSLSYQAQPSEPHVWFRK